MEVQEFGIPARESFVPIMSLTLLEEVRCRHQPPLAKFSLFPRQLGLNLHLLHLATNSGST